MYVSSLFLSKKKWWLRTLLFSCWPRNLAFLPEWGGCSEQGTGCLFSLPPLVSARPRKTDPLGYSCAPSFFGSPICFGPWGKTSAAVAVVFPLSFIFRLAYVYLKFSWVILVASHLTFSIFSRPPFFSSLLIFCFSCRHLLSSYQVFCLGRDFAKFLIGCFHLGFPSFAPWRLFRPWTWFSFLYFLYSITPLPFFSLALHQIFPSPLG